MVTMGDSGHNDERGTAPATVSAALERVCAELESSELYFGHGTDNAWDESVQLVLAAVQLPSDSSTEVLDRELEEGDWQRIDALLRRRIRERRPLPYLTGRGWFAGLEFLVDERALVPRSPMAELIVDDYRPWWRGTAPRRILDLCCGGGAIGIAAAHYLPQAEVLLADIDADALALAAENIARHGLEDRVTTCRSNLLQNLEGEAFDLILCNPPYVDAGDIAAMPAEYRREPLHALAAGGDGLDLALEILASAAHWLRPGGLLFLELGNSWEALEALCPHVPLTWVEFAHGGHGVLCMDRDELLEAQACFAPMARARRGDGV
jgi:ribosomal protein L3 glutamine methyltransferase